MLAINLPTWLVDIWAAYADVIVPALVAIVLAVLTWLAVTIKADAKARAAKSDAELAALQKMNEKEDTRPELNALTAEVADLKISNRYLAEIVDCAFQNSTLNEKAKTDIALLKNKLIYGVKEDLVEELTAKNIALEEQIAGLQEQLKEATTVVAKTTRTRR
jgi:cell division protein FtsB